MDPVFFGLAASVATAVLLLLDAVRFCGVPGVRWICGRFAGLQLTHITQQLGAVVAAAMEPFRDAQDPGPFLLTHVYLLVAAALPSWILAPTLSPASSSPSFPVLFALLSGILSVVVGDGIAAVVGSHWGRRRWTQWSHKTLEGSGASLLAQAGLVLALWRWCGAAYAWEWPLLQAVVAVTVGVTAEALGTQIDNLVLPALVLALAPV